MNHITDQSTAEGRKLMMLLGAMLITIALFSCGYGFIQTDNHIKNYKGPVETCLMTQSVETCQQELKE